MNSNVPNYFVPILSYPNTPCQFIDVIGYCLYKGLSLNFSANKNTGEYFGYFTEQDDNFINSDCFRFSDLNEYLFARQSNFNQYILQHKVVVKLQYKHKLQQYQLEIKKEVYDVLHKQYTWVSVLKVRSSKIKKTFVKMNQLLQKGRREHQNEKVIEMKLFRHD